MAEDTFVAGGAPPNAGDPVRVRTLATLLAEKAEQDKADLATLLAMPEGRRFLWRLLEHASPYASTFALNHASMALAEGTRQVGTWLVVQLQALGEETYPRLMVEGMKDRKMDQLIRDARIAEAKKRDLR